jgi:hypothetical protein
MHPTLQQMFYFLSLQFHFVLEFMVQLNNHKPNYQGGCLGKTNKRKKHKTSKDGKEKLLESSQT